MRDERGSRGRGGAALPHPQWGTAEGLSDGQEHRARLHQPAISPHICSWIFKPQTRPNSTPIKVNKSLPIDYGCSWIRAILMFTRSQIQGLITFILLHIRSLFTPLFTGLQTSKKFWSQSHTELHLHPWLARWELQRRVWICITQSGSAQKPAGRSRAIRQHKEIEMEFLGERDH